MKKHIFSSSRDQGLDQDHVDCSLAVQHESMTATVSFRSAEVKARALKHAADQDIVGTDWEIDDKFDGLTVLYTPDSIDLE